MNDEYAWLKAEKADLISFLRDLPEDEIFMRPWFEYRLKKVMKKLEDFERLM